MCCISIVVLLFFSCNFMVNEKTSWISTLNTECLDDSAWIIIKRDYSTDSVTDKNLLWQIDQIKKMPFPSDVLYFKEGPEELIGVQYYGVRYVYNKNISFQVLDGLSPELSESEKQRIQDRIQTLLMEYQCDSVKLRSQEIIE